MRRHHLEQGPARRALATDSARPAGGTIIARFTGNGPAIGALLVTSPTAFTALAAGSAGSGRATYAAQRDPFPVVGDRHLHAWFGNPEAQLDVAAITPGAGVPTWRAVTAILVKKEPEGDHDEAPADGHGEMAVGSGDRIATIMPVLRGFALALIVLTTALTALSALGVDVGPLIASAGILGLAIGFGAQTLVTDIISGMFYLYEDAIRIGEYVESESGSGTVERISLRSATLRHPRGAVITVPFSKMGTIKNHSRDWVVMKFSFRVPADTDVEKVRKLIKNVGQQMAEDPEIKDKILAPLKSQGAIGITGRGFDIGCKFMSVPGEQFVIRRKAFVLLQRALKENGIALAGQDFDFQAIQTGSPGPS